MTEDDYLVPRWEDAGRVHDWRNYATDELKVIWPSFSRTQKRVIAMTLDEAASREEWE